MTNYTELDTVHCADIFDLCAAQPSQSVDMILCDLPYGNEKTKLEWDNVIPIESMWEAFKRIIKPRGAIVLTAGQPFTSMLIMSNLDMYRYQWFWHKSRGSNFGMVQHQPLRIIEDVLVFSHTRASKNQFIDETMNYYPQRTKLQKPYIRVDKTNHVKITSPSKSSHVHNPQVYTHVYEYQSVTNVLHFNMDSDPDRGLHSTQKPVDLFRYLIRTYTQAGELIFDPTCGSGTTAIAAREEQRHFICGDRSAEYVAIAQKRLEAPYTLPMFASGD